MLYTIIFSNITFNLLKFTHSKLKCRNFLFQKLKQSYTLQAIIKNVNYLDPFSASKYFHSSHLFYRYIYYHFILFPPFLILKQIKLLPKHASKINAKRKCQFKKELHNHQLQNYSFFTLSYILDVGCKPSLIF